MQSANMQNSTSRASDTGLEPGQRNYTGQAEMIRQLNLSKDDMIKAIRSLQQNVNQYVDKYYQDKMDQMLADAGVDGGKFLSTFFMPGMKIFTGINGIIDSISDITASIQASKSRDEMQQRLDIDFQKFVDRVQQSKWFE